MILIVLLALLSIFSPLIILSTESITLQLTEKKFTLSTHKRESSFFYFKDWQKKRTMNRFNQSILEFEAFNNNCWINGKKTNFKDILVYSSDETIECGHLLFKSPVHCKAYGDFVKLTGTPLKKSSLPKKLATQLHYQDKVKQHNSNRSLKATQTIEAICKENQKKELTIRVLLDSCATHDQKQWVLTNKTGFTVLKNRYQRHNETQQQEIVICVKHGTLLLNNRPLKSKACYIQTHDNLFAFNKKEYKGAFLIAINEKKVFLMNCVSLEDYVYAVVRSESWPGWPLEVNKVFAIACRSYALHTILHARKTKRIYHIKDTNAHQRYNLYGEHNNTTVQKAVKETDGLCLTFNNSVALAMFDSCCGGVIPADVDTFNFKTDPYLARTYPCTFCKTTSLFSWSITTDLQKIESSITKSFPSIGQYKHIKIKETDRAGIVKKLLIQGSKSAVETSGKWLHSILKGIKSDCYSIIQKGSQITVKGKGFGHFVGLCQWGAKEMAKQGWNFKQILAYYYPGTRLKKLL